MKRNKKRIAFQVVFLNLVFILTALIIYRLLKGTVTHPMMMLFIFFALINGLFIYISFWFNETFYRREIFYSELERIPNQNYLKTLNKKHFKNDNILLVSIILSNHNKLIKVFDEMFFYKIMNNLYDRFKKKLKAKNIIISNNIRKKMLIIDGDNYLDSLNIIVSVLEEEILIEDIPIKLEFNIGYYLKENNNILTDDNIFFECDVASTYALNNSLKAVCFNEIEDIYQYDYNLLKLIPNAINDEELFFYYQPIIPASKEEYLYLEMLIRWQRDDLVIMPNDFIPQLEETLLINDISVYVLKKAIDEIKKYLLDGYKVAMSINVSAKNLISDSFVEDAIKLIKESNLDPYHFEFEITEGSAINFTEKLIKNMSLLEALGIKVSIDDFGSGFSSMSYFNKMPINFVKIDKEITSHINQNKNSNSLIKNLIVLLHELGYGVVSEGVETKEQLDFLLESGIDYVQGYHISKPLSYDDTKTWVEKNYNKHVIN